MTAKASRQVKHKPQHKGQHIHRPTTNWVTHKFLRSPPALNGLPVNVTTMRRPQFSLLSNEIESVSVQEKRLTPADNRLRGSGAQESSPEHNRWMSPVISAFSEADADGSFARLKNSLPKQTQIKAHRFVTQ